MTNTVLLIGRLTKDIEVRYNENEVGIGNFTIAVTRNYKNINGEYETDFINCVCFKHIVDTMKQYTKKGDLLGIKGRLQTRNYEDKKGIKHYVTEVIVEKISFLSSRKEPTIIDGKTPIVTDEMPF